MLEISKKRIEYQIIWKQIRWQIEKWKARLDVLTLLVDQIYSIVACVRITRLGIYLYLLKASGRSWVSVLMQSYFHNCTINGLLVCASYLVSECYFPLVIEYSNGAYK